MNRERLLGLIKQSRFPGLLYQQADGSPAAITNGHWLVVFAPLDVAPAFIEGSTASGNLPPTLEVSKLLRAARRAPRHYEVKVSPDLEPDPDLRARGLAFMADREAQSMGRIEKAKKSLEKALREGYGITDARERLSALKAVAKREAKEPVVQLSAVKVGDACFDLRVVRAALSAMGSKVGTLAGTGAPRDQGVLTTDGNSIGLMMPFLR